MTGCKSSPEDLESLGFTENRVQPETEIEIGRQRACSSKYRAKRVRVTHRKGKDVSERSETGECIGESEIMFQLCNMGNAKKTKYLAEAKVRRS